jgi:predicted alpha/beta-hydrolase family hydrolase
MPDRIEEHGVCGFLHAIDNPRGAIALTHGAGSNCTAALLVAVAEAFAEARFVVLRYDLPFRQARPTGPPAGSQAKDRDGIRAASAWLRAYVPAAPLTLAGHSYGGRQSTMLAAEDPQVADWLLLLSYPLHPPKQPEKLRTEHFDRLRTPALFVHGVKDEFGTIEELDRARLLIPAHTQIQSITGVGHGLHVRFAAQIVDWFVTFTSK